MATLLRVFFRWDMMLLMNKQVLPESLLTLKKRMRRFTVLTLVSAALGGPVALLLFHSATGLIPSSVIDAFAGFFVFLLFIPIVYPLAGLAILAAPLFGSLLLFTALELRAEKRKTQLVAAPRKGIVFRSFVLYVLFWLVIALGGASFEAVTATESLFWQNANGARGISPGMFQSLSVPIAIALGVLAGILFMKGRKGMLISEVVLGILSIFAILAVVLYWVIVLTVGQA